MLFGPWLCVVVSQGLPGYPASTGVPGLIAAGRIAVDPRATFRPVGGVVLAASAVTYIGSTVDQFQSPDKRSAVRVWPGVVHVFTGGGGTGAGKAVGRGRPDGAEDRDARYEHVV
jgi:hypothetical protein